MGKHARERIERSSESYSKLHAMFHVYEDELFLGKRILSKGSLSIGSSRKADILLNHKSVEKIHAVVNVEGNRLILNNNYPSDGLKVNGLSVESVPLRSRDVINIGPFDIHVEIEAPKKEINSYIAEKQHLNDPNSSYLIDDEMNRKNRKSNLSKLVLIDQYPSVDAKLQAASKLSRVFGKDNQTWLSLLSKERYVIKEKVGEETAKLWQKKLQTAGIFCRVEKDGAESTKEDLKSITYYPITASASASLKIREEIVETPYEEIEIEASQKYFSADEEIDEDDEEDALWVAPFSLKNKLEKTHRVIKAPRHLPKHLSIIKSIGSVVSDATHLAPRSTYKIVSKKGSQKLAQFSAKGIGQIFFTEKMKGHIQYADKTKVNLDQYKQDSQFYSRWKKIYRLTVPEDASVILFDGDITYSINYAALESLPDVKESIMPNALTWRH